MRKETGSTPQHLTTLDKALRQRYRIMYRLFVGEKWDRNVAAQAQRGKHHEGENTYHHESRYALCESRVR